MKHKILVLGASGMLGGSIFRGFSNNPEFEVLGSFRSTTKKEWFLTKGFQNIVSNVDANQFSSIESIIKTFNPDTVINCIGVIKQQEAAKSPEHSIYINSLFPHKLAGCCSRNDSRLIHFSTDCVFDGYRGMYCESDLPNAQDLYGRSKLLGEVDYDSHVTLRTSIIGHEIGSNISLVDWFLSQKNLVNGYNKTIFSGLPTVYVAEIIRRHIVGKSIFGLRHLSVDAIDKYSLLKLISNVYDKQINIRKSESIIIDRSLNSEKLRAEVGYVPEIWPELIKRMYEEYQQYF